MDLRGIIVEVESGLRAKAELSADRFAAPTPGPSMRVPRHTSTPKVTHPEVQAALQKTQRKKAPGPDGVYPEYLRDGLSPGGLAYLTALVDSSVHAGYLPRGWKHAHWIPVSKPRKPAQEASSYRPVSLTSVLSKVAERVMDARIMGTKRAY